MNLNDLKRDKFFYNLKRVNSDYFSINSNKDNFIQYENKIYEVNKWINKVYHSNINLRIVALNVQRLNKSNDSEAWKKLNFIKEEIANTNCDIVFLIDVGERVKDIKIPNYKLYDDGRNLLAVKTNIKLDVKVNDKKPVFKVNNSDLIFTYIRPLEKDQEVLKEVCEYIKSNKCVIGDVNIKSNPEIAKAATGKVILGENTLQTLLIQKNTKAKVRTFFAPSDHKGILIDIKKYVPHNAGVIIEKLDLEKSYDLIDQIFEKGKIQTPIKFKSISRVNYGNDEENLTRDILNAYLNKDLGKCYKAYENWWKKLKKEPFLGCEVPQSVEDSLRTHYKEIKDKSYDDIDVELLNDINIEDLNPKDASNSSAKNNELIELGEIDRILKLKWAEIKETDDEGEIISFDKAKAIHFLKNFIKAANLNKSNQSCKSFFLRKNKNRLELFHDVRIIVISPIFMKIWETLIYEKTVKYIGDKVNGEIKYQYGGIKEGSTYFTILDLQRKYYKNKGKGILFIDIAKGYDSVNWLLLKEMIEKIEDVSVKNMLRIWYQLLVNIDVDINNNKIKKGRGLGMGFTLAPAIFIYYVDEAIRESKIDKKKIAMYIDDLSMILNKMFDKEDFVKLIDTFKKYDMEVNSTKCAIITADEDIKKEFQELAVPIRNSEKYLGVELRLSEQNTFIVDNRFYYIKKEFFCLPKVISFVVKRLIYFGAILAKIRYSAMMYSIKHIKEKSQLLKLIWSLFKLDFPKLSYLQVLIFGLNFFRFFVDMNDLEIIKEQCDKLPTQLERTKKANEIIIQKYKTGIEQIDNRMENIEVVIDDPQNWVINMQKCQLFAEVVRNKVLYQFISEWEKEKIKQKKSIYPKLGKFVDSKFVINCKVIEMILLHHYDENELDMNLFIMHIIILLGKRIKKKDNVLDEYILGDIIIPNDQYRHSEFLTMFYNNLVQKCFDTFDTLMNIDGKKEYKDLRIQVFKILCWLDNIYTKNRYNKCTINELCYSFNLAIAINLKTYDTIGKIIDEENNNVYKKINDVDINESINVFSIDGSFNNKLETGGAGVIYKLDNGIYEKRYFSIPNVFKEEKNVAAELLATLWSIRTANKLKLKEMCIIFDYLGNVYYSKGLWNVKSDKLAIIINAIHKELKNSDINITWIKADSHTNIWINDEADRLSKIASGLENANNNDIEDNSPI